MTRPSALFYAIVSTALYVFVLVVLHAKFANFPGDIASRLNLNVLGDSIGGLTAPVALIWLIAAVVTQRQELNLTKEELSKTADAMQKQVELMAEQSVMQREVARSNLKVTLFQERFALYSYFSKFANDLYRNVRADTLADARNHIQKVKYVFGREVYASAGVFSDLVNSLFHNIEYYEHVFGSFPVRDDDGVLTFFNSGPDDEQESRMHEIDADLYTLRREVIDGSFVCAMRAALELDADIDFQKGIVET